MPEGHSVHRIARQFRANFVGHTAHVTSPQSRFDLGAAELDGRTMTDSRAIGKHLLLTFDERTLHVHLGIYGAWDFAGNIEVDPTLASAGGRMGQTQMRGAGTEGENEASIGSIGAPRLARLRAGESEQPGALGQFPPEPVGQVRVRILTAAAVADLRGPTVCEVLSDADVRALAARLGPDPQALNESRRSAQARFVSRAGGSRQPIGQLLMDQSVVAGIGNVYRAELLFRAMLDPHRPGNTVPEETLRSIWNDWAKLLNIGIQTGQMLTIDGLRGAKRAAALANRSERHWVYRRQGMPCRRCATPIALEEMQGRKLYWCPGCQR